MQAMGSTLVLNPGQMSPEAQNGGINFLPFVILHVSMPGLLSTAREAGPSTINMFGKMKKKYEEQV